MTEIEWIVTAEDDADFFGSIGKQVTLLQGGWPGVAMHCEQAAQKVAEDYFSTLNRRWKHWFGDQPSGSVRLRIYSPKNIAGDYLIDLTLVTEVHAQKLKAENNG